MATRVSQSTKARTGLRRIMEELKRDGTDRLPSEAELLSRLGVGRNTVRKVIGELAAEGALRRIQGKGTFIVSQFRKLRFANWASTELPPALFLDRLVAEFQGANPDLQVENIDIPYHQYLERLMVLLLHGDSPDVVQLTPFWLRYLQRLKLFIPLDGYVSHQLIHRRYPTAFSLGRIDNSIYSLNWALCPLVLYYNKPVLKKAGLDPDRPPRTLEELADMSIRVGQSGQELYGLSLPFALYELSFDCLYVLLLSFGGGFTDSIGNIIVDSPSNVAALSWLQRLYHAGGIKKEQNLNGARVLFASNHLAFMIDGPQGRGYLRTLSGLDREFDAQYGIVEMPVGPTGRSESVLLTPSLAISAYSRMPDQAYRWIEFLVNNEENARLYFDRYGAIPCNRDTLNRPYFFADPFASVLIRQLESASASPVDHPLFLRSVPFMLQTVARIIFEGLDPEEGLRFLSRVINMIGNSDLMPYM